MSTTQANVESKVRTAKAAPKAKPMSAAAIRMQRARDQKKYLERLAETHRQLFFEVAFKRLAEENPKGSSGSAVRWINNAWLKAGRVPSEARKYLATLTQ